MQFITKTQCFKGSWRDTAQALCKLPLPIFITFALLLMVGYTVDRFPAASFTSKIASSGVFFLTTFLSLIISAQLVVRVTRYSLLGEAQSSDTSTLPRYLLLSLITFCGACILVPFAILLCFMLSYLLHSFHVAISINAVLFVGGAGFVWVRLSLLYPHTAAGGKLDWRHAWYDTQDHFWEMLVIFVGTTLPIGIVSTVWAIYLPHVFTKLKSAGLVHDIWTFCVIALHVVNLVTSAACSAWIYRSFAKELQLPGSRPRSSPPRAQANLHQRIKQSAS